MKIRLTGNHATKLRSSKQMSACNTAVKQINPNIMSNNNVYQPRISTYYPTVIPRTWDRKTEKQTRTGKLSLKILMSSKMEGKSDWLGIRRQCCDSAGRWAHVTLQSNENYRTSRQRSSLINQGSGTNISLWYQEHADRQKHNFSDKRQTANFHWNY